MKEYRAVWLKLTFILQNLLYYTHSSFGFYLFWIFFLFLILTREHAEREEDRVRETLIGWLSSTCAPAGDQTHSPGMCHEWQPFGAQNDAQPTKLLWPGLFFF